MSYSLADYRICAQNLVTQIADPTTWETYVEPELNFWRIANAFTTLIDSFVTMKQGNSFLVDSILKEFKRKNSPGWWYDDYSWWGVAFVQAARHSDLVGGTPPAWLASAQVCWDEMAPATQVWEKADKTIFAEAKPRFDGGCWNHAFVPSDCDPLNSDDLWPVCGIQNTVTNAQYLVFAARFSRSGEALREYGWLRNWFSDASLSADQKLLVSYGGGRLLVRERVSIFDKLPNGTYPQTLNYDPARRWTGDQGILLGVLLEMIRLDPTRQAEYYTLARGILDAVRTELVNAQMILQPWAPSQAIGQQYLTDYGTGTGVYMRYLLYAAQNDTTLKQYIQSSASLGFIRANADAVCASLGTCQPLPGGSPLDQMECRLNQLAVLNAAINLLG